jgi:hypothetical protein
MARRLPLPETNDSEGPMRALLTALLFAASPAFAALEARDINRDGNVDAYFDTTQNLTWLDMASDGWWFAFSQSEAQSMVAGLAVLGFDDWRLPEGLGAASELTRLVASMEGRDDPFESPQRNAPKWTAETGRFSMTGMGNTTPDLNGEYTLAYIWTPRGEFADPNFLGAGVLAVRDGDVASARRLAAVTAVPEPSTYALMLGSLAALAVWVRRKAATVSP